MTRGTEGVGPYKVKSISVTDELDGDFESTLNKSLWMDKILS